MKELKDKIRDQGLSEGSALIAEIIGEEGIERERLKERVSQNDRLSSEKLENILESLKSAGIIQRQENGELILNL